MNGLMILGLIIGGPCAFFCFINHMAHVKLGVGSRIGLIIGLILFLTDVTLLPGFSWTLPL